jgi:hypothetical protein
MAAQSRNGGNSGGEPAQDPNQEAAIAAGDAREMIFSRVNRLLHIPGHRIVLFEAGNPCRCAWLCRGSQS